MAASFPPKATNALKQKQVNASPTAFICFYVEEPDPFSLDIPLVRVHSTIEQRVCHWTMRSFSNFHLLEEPRFYWGWRDGEKSDAATWNSRE
jgi:hypothetical protein